MQNLKPPFVPVAALACVLLAVVGGCSSRPGTVAELLDASAAAYRDHGGYSHRLAWRYLIDVPADGTRATNSGNHTLAVAPDGRFRFGEFDGVVAYGDGRDLIAHRPYSGNYQSISLASGQAWPEAVPVAGKYIRLGDPAAVLATGDATDWVDYGLIDVPSAELIEDSSDGRIGIRARIDGSSLLGGPTDQVELWFDGETYLLESMKVDSRLAFLAGKDLPDSTEAEVFFAVDVSDVRTGADAILSPLVFAPRPQDHLVAELVPAPEKRQDASVLAFLDQPAPAISAETLTREGFELSSLRGDVVLLDFWASWCGSCLRSKPGIKSLGETFADDDFTIVSVSLDNADHRESVERLVASSGIDAVNIPDPDNRISTDFRVIVQPTFVLIDADGVIRHVQMGPLVDERLETLREEIDGLLTPVG